MKARPNPTKILYVGDFGRCAQLEPIGRRMINELHTRILLSKGRLKQAWAVPVRMEDGATIYAAVLFNNSLIRIDTKTSWRKGLGPAVEYPKEEECFCTCDISFGTVTKKPREMLDGWIPLYDVECCYKGESIVFYENILASDFSAYQVGQNVLVMAYHDFQYGCCALGEDFVDGVATACQPIVETRETDDLLWRTTYRIVPICPDAIDEWEETQLASRTIEDANEL